MWLTTELWCVSVADYNNLVPTVVTDYGNVVCSFIGVTECRTVTWPLMWLATELLCVHWGDRLQNGGEAIGVTLTWLTTGPWCFHWCDWPWHYCIAFDMMWLQNYGVAIGVTDCSNLVPTVVTDSRTVMFPLVLLTTELCYSPWCDVTTEQWCSH